MSGTSTTTNGTAVAVSLGGSGSGAGGTTTATGIGAIASDYAELVAQGANAFTASGAKDFHMQAGDISLASPEQIGRVINGVTVTTAMVAENQQLLDNIASYCRTNGISVSVEAQLENPPGADWTDQWLMPAEQAGLPITQVEGDDEIEFEHPIASFGTVAADEAAVVKHILQYFPNIKIGQWEGVGPTSTTQAWLSAYDSAAQAAGLPQISYLVEDTTWNAPWEVPPTVNSSWELALSTLAAQDHLSLTVLLDGTGTDTSSEQLVAQSEQDAATLGENTGAQVNTLRIQTWWPYPESVLPNNSPSTMSNDAEMVAATFPLYQGGLITAQDPISITAPPQAVVTLGTAVGVGSVSLNWAINDIAKGETAAVVITDESGLLSCTASGGATVTGEGTSELVIDGNATDLAAVLQSLKVLEPTTTADNVDIEVFGVNGRLADAQIDLLAVSNPVTASGNTVALSTGGAGQYWQNAAATVAGNGKIAQIAFTWNAANTDPTTGDYLVTQEVAIHAPLSESGVGYVNGVLEAPAMQSTGTAPINMQGWNPYAFNPSSSTLTVSLLSTTMSYGANSGNLESSTSAIAAYTVPGSSGLGTVGNYLATGGQQVIEYNTGDNPNWNSDWSPLLTSVTTTYGSAGQMLEQFFQGGSSEPWFSLDNVYDPRTGALWEQIQGAPPVGQYSNFVSGPLFVTEFNTGDNPNWDYADWGTAAQVTTGWQDSNEVEVTTQAPVLVGTTLTAAYNMTGGVVPTPTTAGLGGTASYPGYLTIFGGQDATNINTGAGYSTVYLPSVGPAETVTSGGADNIWVGGAATSITNNGSLSDTINAQGATFQLNNNSFTVNGGANSISLGTNTTLTLASATDSVMFKGSGVTLNVGNTATVAATGVTGAVNVTGTADVVTVGNSMSVLITGTADVVQAGDTLTAWTRASGEQLTAGAYATVDEGADADGVILGNAGTVWVSGDHDTASVLSNGVVDIYGTADSTYAGSNSNVWIAGYEDRVQVGTGSVSSIVGNGNTVIASNGATIVAAGTTEMIQLHGTADVITSQASSSMSVYGSHATISCGQNAEASISGMSDNVTAGTGANIVLTGANNTLSTANNCVVMLGGADNNVSLGQSGTICTMSNQDTITAQGGTTIKMYGTGDVGVAGANAQSLVAGSGDQLTLGDDALANVAGATDTATVGISSNVVVTGTYDFISSASGTVDVSQGASDTIRFMSPTGTDTVVGFQPGKSDILDISQLLGGVDLGAGASNLANFVALTASGSNEMMTVTGSSGTTHILLANAGSMTLPGLESTHALTFQH